MKILKKMGVLMTAMVVATMTMSLTACGSDDDKGGSPGGGDDDMDLPLGTVRLDGVDKTIDLENVVYNNGDDWTALELPFKDNTSLRMRVPFAQLGKLVRLNQPIKNFGDSYASVRYSNSNYDYEWYGDTDINELGEAQWILDAGSQITMTKIGNSFTVVGKFVLSGDKNSISDGKKHTFLVNVKVTAKLEDQPR